MKGETYVYRNGRIVNKKRAAPLNRSSDARVHVISDNCEFKSMADGKVYTSKSRYRADLKARGLVEVGTDTSWRRRPTIDQSDVKTDIRRAIEQLS